MNNGNATQQSSSAPISSTKMKMAWLCLFTRVFTLYHLKGLGPVAFRVNTSELGYSHWRPHDSCEDETCTKHVRVCWLQNIVTHLCSTQWVGSSTKCSWGAVQRCEQCCPEQLYPRGTVQEAVRVSWLPWINNITAGLKALGSNATAALSFRSFLWLMCKMKLLLAWLEMSTAETVSWFKVKKVFLV